MFSKNELVSDFTNSSKSVDWLYELPKCIPSFNQPKLVQTDPGGIGNQLPTELNLIPVNKLIFITFGVCYYQCYAQSINTLLPSESQYNIYLLGACIIITEYSTSQFTLDIN